MFVCIYIYIYMYIYIYIRCPTRMYIHLSPGAPAASLPGNKYYC